MSNAPIGEAFVEVSANTSKFRSDLEKGVKAGLTQVTTQAAGFGTALKASLAGASDALAGFGRTASTTGRKLLTSVTLPVIGIGVAAFKMSAGFETAMAKIEGLVGVANDQVVAWGDEVKKLAPIYGKSAAEAADALFFITSSGIAAADTMDVLSASLKAAAIGLGDTATIATLVTSAMNAYGAAALPAGKATDILVAAVREGKLEADQLAGAMSRVLPIASEMGVGFDQVGAAFAAMSLTGTSASEAATQIRGILSSLIKPTKEASDTLVSLGLSADGLRKQLREKGLLSVLETLVSSFGNNEEAAAKVFGNIRALTGVMSLMGENTAGTARIFDELTRTTGATDDAFAIIAKTAGFKMAQAFTDLKIAVMSFGDILAPHVAKFGEAVQRFSAWFRELDARTKKFILMGLGIAATLGPVLILIGALASSLAILINPITLVVAGIAALVAGLVYAYAKFEAFREIVNAVGTVLKFYAQVTVNVVKLLWDLRWVLAAVTVALVALNAKLLITTALFVAALFPVASLVVAVTALAAAAVWVSRKLADSSSETVRFRRGMVEANNAAAGLDVSLSAAAQRLELVSHRSKLAASWLKVMASAAAHAADMANELQSVLDARATLIQQEKKAHYEVAAAVTTYANTTTAAKVAVESFAKAVREGLTDALNTAKSALDTARQAFATFAESVSTKLMEAFNFTDAAEAGKETGGGFLAGLRAQLANLTGYTDAVQAALNLGLSQDALQLVLAAGQRAGTDIANELVAGGKTAIDTTNELVAAATAAADKVGLNAASRWYQSGVDFAQKVVDGLTNAISAMTPKVMEAMDAIAAKMKRTVDIDVRITERVNRIVTTITAGIPKAAHGIPKFGHGEIVTRPTFAMVGDAGDEAVIPITRPRRALQLMEESGLAGLVRANSNKMSSAVHIENATFATPSDADLVAQRVMAGFQARLAS